MSVRSYVTNRGPAANGISACGFLSLEFSGVNLSGSNSCRAFACFKPGQCPNFDPDYLGVVPDIGAAVDGVGDDDDPGAGREAPPINLCFLLQHAAVGGDGGVQSQTLLDAVLEIRQLTQVLPACMGEWANSDAEFPIPVPLHITTPTPISPLRTVSAS